MTIKDAIARLQRWAKTEGEDAEIVQKLWFPVDVRSIAISVGSPDISDAAVHTVMEQMSRADGTVGLCWDSISDIISDVLREEAKTAAK